MNEADPRVRLARRVLSAGIVLVFVALAGWGIVALHPWPRHGADRVKHAIDWPSDCAAIATVRAFPNSEVSAWHPVDARIIRCDFLGPAVFYARFRNSVELRRRLRARPPEETYCALGSEVVTDDLDSGFSRMCDRLNGRVYARGELPQPAR